MNDKNQIKKDSDNKAIEEKALLAFKDYIVDSKIISQYINENDKEPIWDGSLYLYNSHKDNEHFIGRVPVQVKGTEVKKFKVQKYKFPIEISDLKAYLHDPTVFVVCQEKVGSKERKLFYRSFLPETVKNILKGCDNTQKSKSVLFHQIPEDLKIFEERLLMFCSDSKKQLSYADSRPFTIQDVRQKGINSFTVTVPADEKGNLFHYLSTHTSFVYAQLDKDFGFEIPIADGPFLFSFKRDVTAAVSISGKEYFSQYTTEIVEGRIHLNIGNVMFINLPMTEEDKIKPVVNCKLTVGDLRDTINAAEFFVALSESHSICIGENVFELEPVSSGRFDVDSLKQSLTGWKQLQETLDKLNVTKRLDLTKIKTGQQQDIRRLIDSILFNQPFKQSKQRNRLQIVGIGDLNVLTWLAVGKDDMCLMGDYFDGRTTVKYKYPRNPISVSPFFYLQNERLWEICDNIPFAQQIPSYEKMSGNTEYAYEIANFDVLYMLQAFDHIERTDVDRATSILDAAENLNSWLSENDLNGAATILHRINMLQILKRKRDLCEEEVNELLSLLDNTSTATDIKIGAALLLGKLDVVDSLMTELGKDQGDILKVYPIWRFYERN